MDPALLILLLLGIPVAVFILGSLFRATRDDPPKEGGWSAARSDTASTERRKVPGRTDLDRFLAEVQRRRQEAEQPGRQAPQESPSPAAERREVQPAEEMPARTGRSARPPRRRPQRPPAPPSPRRPLAPQPVVLEEVALVLPAVEEKRLADVLPATPAVVTPTPPALLAVPPPPAPARTRSTAPVLAQLTALLRSPQSLGTAIVLREIFDPPLCRRDQRRNP